MRPIRSSLAVLVLAMAATSPATAATPDADTGAVQVRFSDPARFADVRDRPLGSVAADDPVLAELARFVRSQAAPALAAGQTLEVTITDVDRAGQFEPRRGPTLDAVRVVRDVTPPRIDLSFRLRNADGQEAKAGERKLRDLGFLSRLREFPVDPLRHEKRLLADWIERDLTAAPAR